LFFKHRPVLKKDFWKASPKKKNNKLKELGNISKINSEISVLDLLQYKVFNKVCKVKYYYQLKSLDFFSLPKAFQSKSLDLRTSSNVGQSS